MAQSTLTDLAACVAEFHDAFQIGNNHSPNRLGAEEQVLRYSLMREENEEYLEAAQQGNLIEIADALGDQLYILLGTALRHGLMDKMEAVFLEIHRSNMSKLDAKGKPIFREDGKVLKSDRYFRPNIAAFFKEEELGL